jgi:hypothetical protein
MKTFKQLFDEEMMSTNSGIAGLGKDGPADWVNTRKKKRSILTRNYIEVNGKIKKREK